VDALADKWLAHLLFEAHGIGSPPTWLPGAVPDDLAFPVLVKARHGFGSRGIYRCHDRRELEFFLGNAVLSMLTKIASGYWHVADSQSGYTAIGKETLALLDLDRVYTYYGFPNDLLVHLNVVNARVRDFPSRPVYGVGERSGIRYHKVAPRISWLLIKAFFWRLREKYVIRDFHPLVFFYAFGFLATLAGLVLGIVEIAYRIAGNAVSVGTVVLIALLLISGSQFTLFAMWFDMESNKDLR
jgi:hypothetical protein